MHKLLPLAILLALPAMASAADRDCLISFSGAEQNVCDGTASTVTHGMDGLLSVAAVQDSALRVVKFDGPISEAQRKAVETAGARIISYAPYYAYIVRMPARLDDTMRGIDGVVWSGPLLPALKVDANIYNELKTGGIIDGLGISELSISLAAEGNGDVARRAINTIPGLAVSRVVQVPGALRVQAGFDRASLADAVQQLAQRDDVLAIGFHKPARLYNSQGHWLHQSNVNTPIPLKPVWDQGVYGCGQVVGELDTGLWMDNVAFKDASQPLPVDVCTGGTACAPIAAPNLNARKVIAYYKWSGLSGTSWGDDHGHGTHVAGSIIGNDNVANPGTDCVNFTTPGGDTNLDGMAPGAKLVMQESGGNLAYLNNFGGTPYHAADIAYQNGARIHSNSWGGGCTNIFGMCITGCTVTYDQQAQDADHVMQDHDDLLMVFAAGNDATECPNGNNVGSPGNAKNVLTVGATGRGTAGNNMASFSSRGPTLDSRTKPDIDAQGSGIISADRSANGTLSMSGTSMATPTTSGLAALVRDYLARGFYPDGEKNATTAITDPSGALVKAIMISGAVDMTGTGAGPSPSQSQGFGRVHLDNSLFFAGDVSRLFIHDDTDGLATGGAADFSVSVIDGSIPLTVVLTWTDVPGAVGASPATVNSLRLEVTAPNGDTWTQKLPANYNVNNANPVQDTTTEHYDDLNTVQRIRLATPLPGAYDIRVRGINVPQGPQTFALAATGHFDISTDPDFSLSAAPGTAAICAGAPAEFDVGVRSRYGFTGPVTLSATGLPGATTASFGSNPVVPADPAALSHLTIGNTGALARGSYSFGVSGSASGGALAHAISASLKVSVGMPASPAPTAPLDGETDVARSPTFGWTADAAAEGYAIEVATDAAFTNIVASATPATNSWMPGTPLTPLTTYYWRVRALSACGDSAWSTVRSFTTGVTFPEPYCVVTFPSGVEPISLVDFAGIHNTSPAAVSGAIAHEDFLGVAGGMVMTGQSYPMTVEGNTNGNYTTVVNAFIDWNRNGQFEEAAYPIGSIVNSTGADGKQAVGTIAVPLDATPGPVRLRVIKRYSAAATDACNSTGYGQAEDYTLMVQGSGDAYHVGGSIDGANGDVVLKLNGGADHAFGNGDFSFPEAVFDGMAYAVTVSAAPMNQACSVTNGSGTIAGADVDDVMVECVTLPTHVVGGTVNGLTANGLVLKLNDAENLPVTADGPFAFNSGLVNGASYSVGIASQPFGQACTVANGSGTMGDADIADVAVNCVDIPPVSHTVGGRVRGLKAPGLVLQLNDGITLAQNANGIYAFNPGVAEGADYLVTVLTQPAGQTCAVSNASGTMGHDPIDDVDVNCVDGDGGGDDDDIIFADGFDDTP